MDICKKQRELNQHCIDCMVNNTFHDWCLLKTVTCVYFPRKEKEIVTCSFCDHARDIKTNPDRRFIGYKYDECCV